MSALGGMGPGTRATSIERFAGETFDVCVVGGGITGAGVALELAARGRSVALIEGEDFASGASSRSTKLIHGGLRYLARGDVGVSRAAAREREALIRTAPHLVRPIRLLCPVRSRGRGATLRAGLLAYDALGGVRRCSRHRVVSPAQAALLAPALRLEGLRAAFTFGEAVTDDWRLVLGVLEQAVRRGAAIANHVRAVSFETVRGRLVAVNAIDAIAASPVRIHARSFVNATGACADVVAGIVEGSAPSLRPSKGIHLVVPAERLPLACACVFPASDGRELIAIPRGSVVLIGTTDTSFDGGGPPAVDVRDARYVLDALDDGFDAGIRLEDVHAAWAGVRPLLEGASANTADLSRAHRIDVGDSGLVTVVGGKLSTFRRMAGDVAHTLGGGRPVRTGIGGAAPDLLEWTFDAIARLGLPPTVARRLLSAHGDRAPELTSLIREDTSLAEPLVPNLEPLAVEAVWAVRGEMAGSLEDVLDRRLGLALFDRDAGVRSRAPELVCAELGRDVEAEVRSYLVKVRRERGPIRTSDAGPSSFEQAPSERVQG
ncbi:MAG TPA: glycerol-3-phosphate dehydrogenase/oxidase [Actinomycetota bacterium]|nr:glycerol-3-phosphate dehydrogenase/oxidase [Actinomycetota bacterium]